MLGFLPFVFPNLITAITFILDGNHTTSYTIDLAMNICCTEVRYKRWWRRKPSKLNLVNRLGTLQYLPREIRQHIFMMVLVGSIDEHYKAVDEYDRAFSSLGHIDCERPKTLELRYQRKGANCCSILSNQKPAFAGVFNLASYCDFRPRLRSVSLNIRLASRSIQAEFDYIFLTRSTFAFECPTALRIFLDHLTPLQQGQLRRLKLCMFGSRFRSICSERSRDQWLYQCRKLPPNLTSVEFVMPYRLRNIYRCWMYNWMGEDDATLRDVAEVLKVFCMIVVRAVPRARISYSGHLIREIVERDGSSLGLALLTRDSIKQHERDVLDAMLRKVEPWRKFLSAWMDAWNA